MFFLILILNFFFKNSFILRFFVIKYHNIGKEVIVMEINKCSRCGNFYTTGGNVCPNCMAKDAQDLMTFKTYLENNQNETSLNNVSYKTGISQTHLTRFLGYEGFENYGKNFN